MVEPGGWSTFKPPSRATASRAPGGSRRGRCRAGPVDMLGGRGPGASLTLGTLLGLRGRAGRGGLILASGTLPGRRPPGACAARGAGGEAAKVFAVGMGSHEGAASLAARALLVVHGAAGGGPILASGARARRCWNILFPPECDGDNLHAGRVGSLPARVSWRREWVVRRAS
jgi:hypothetical protein